MSHLVTRYKKRKRALMDYVGWFVTFAILGGAVWLAYLSLAIQ